MPRSPHPHPHPFAPRKSGSEDQRGKAGQFRLLSSICVWCGTQQGPAPLTCTLSPGVRKHPANEQAQLSLGTRPPQEARAALEPGPAFRSAHAVLPPWAQTSGKRRSTSCLQPPSPFLNIQMGKAAWQGAGSSGLGPMQSDHQPFARGAWATMPCNEATKGFPEGWGWG